MGFTVLFLTLGCKVNQYDSGAMLEEFGRRGFAPWRGGPADNVDGDETPAQFSGPADDAVDCDPPVCENHSAPDVVVINTCIVTAESERKSRQAIRRLRSRYPDAILAVIGCYPQMYPQKVKEMAGVDYIAGVTGHSAVANEIAGRLNANNPAARGPRAGVYSRTRAYVKIQDGCDNYCGYCIVPYVRGGPKSRALPEVLDEIDAVLARGAPEIVLTGTQISSYRYGTADLGALIYETAKRLAGNRPGPEQGGRFRSEQASRLRSEHGSRLRSEPVRLRLSSLEPTAITDGFVKALDANRDVVCPHFHLSLQSGSESVLKRMNRRYTPERYAEAVALLRGRFPDAGITTDVIAGYPGETENEFLESYDFCKKIAFSKMHVFPYSVRPGTQAAEMPDRTEPRIIRERTAKLLELSDAMSLAFHKTYISKKAVMLVEQSKNGAYEGLTGNYVRVRAYPSRRNPQTRENGALICAANINAPDSREPAASGPDMREPVSGGPAAGKPDMRESASGGPGNCEPERPRPSRGFFAEVLVTSADESYIYGDIQY
jgi:threonylcarbamoyladenosine tRNA methylthiotransferase MtaB